MVLTEIKRHDLIAYGEEEFGENLVFLWLFFLAMTIKALSKWDQEMGPQKCPTEKHW